MTLLAFCMHFHVICVLEGASKNQEKSVASSFANFYNQSNCLHCILYFKVIDFPLKIIEYSSLLLVDFSDGKLDVYSHEIYK